MMLRLAKNKNYVAISPNIKQRAEMNAPQSIPLIMEPESKYPYLFFIYQFKFFIIFTIIFMLCLKVLY